MEKTKLTHWTKLTHAEKEERLAGKRRVPKARNMGKLMLDFLLGHLRGAAVAAKRDLNVVYYFYHLWIALRAGAFLTYLGIMSFVHGVFPPIYGGFGLAKMIVHTVNGIRQSIPDWAGWAELDNWNDEKYS